MNISKQAVLDVLREAPINAIHFIKLTNAVNSLPSISYGWISIDTSPEDERTVLTCTDTGDINMGYYDHDFGWRIYGIGIGTNITHWQALPPAPTK